MTTTQSAYERDKKELLTALEAVGGKLTAEEDIVFQGTKIVLPENMDLGDAVKFLQDKQAEDEKEMNFARTFHYRPWDGARATMIALKRAFGMVQQKGVPGFFGERPPQLITIPVGVNETEQVPWGALAIPFIPDTTFFLSGDRHPELGLLFQLTATGPRKYRYRVEGVFRLVGEELEHNSLYRGKAFDGQEQPEFLDLSGVSPDKVIYADEVMEQLTANVFVPLRYAQQMRDIGEPLKRAILFEGPYGTGKTLGAYLTAQCAVENGWSFIYCRPGRDDLAEVMATARLYQPSVVFYEDVDVVADPTDAAQDGVSKLLDIFDGIQAKNTEIMVVLTTNHKEKIHKGMVRPGRLDAIISIGALDANGIRKLVICTVPGDNLDKHIDWSRVAQSMEGFVPAFAREAIGRATKYNLAHNGGKLTKLSTEDFVAAAEGLRPQLELMENASETALRDPLGVAFRSLADQAARAAVNDAVVVPRGDEEAWARLRVVDAS